jgi:hypothetical protein
MCCITFSEQQAMKEFGHHVLPTFRALGLVRQQEVMALAAASELPCCSMI